jgi:hypothetical protein
MTTTASYARLCDICGEGIDIEISGWSRGHNAEPVVKDGRCCSDCNMAAVIPMRLEAIYGLQR